MDEASRERRLLAKLGTATVAVSRAMADQSEFHASPGMEFGIFASGGAEATVAKRAARAEHAGPRFLREITRTALCDAIEAAAIASEIVAEAGIEAWPDLKEAVVMAASSVREALELDPGLFSHEGREQPNGLDSVGSAAGFPPGWMSMPDGGFLRRLPSGAVLSASATGAFWVPKIGCAAVGVADDAPSAAVHAESVACRLLGVTSTE